MKQSLKEQTLSITKSITKELNFSSPLGAGFFQNTILDRQGEPCKLQIWDTSGQEKYRSIAEIYYKDAKYGILVYDLSDFSSLKGMKDWGQQLMNNSTEDITLVVVANKIDLLLDVAVSQTVLEKEAKIYAQSIGATYYRASAKLNIGINQIFRGLCETYTKKQDKITTRQSNSSIPLESKKKLKSVKCCIQ